MTAFAEHYSTEKLVEFAADVMVECTSCDLSTTIENAELAGNRQEVFLDWTCKCLHRNYDVFDTQSFNDEGF